MAWDLKFGHKLKWFMDLEAEGQEIAALESKPEIIPDLAADYVAFCQLQATRSVGFGGPDPIKFTEMLAYMEMFGIQGLCERRFFLKRMQLIDSLYIEIQKENQPKK